MGDEKMTNHDTSKGVAFALLSTVSVANVYIFSKAALLEFSLATFWFYCFLFGSLWYSLYIVVRGETKNIAQISKKQYTMLAKVGGAITVVGVEIMVLAKRKHRKKTRCNPF